MPDELIIGETSRWMQYAREDLDAAIAMLSGTLRHSCMFAQQSAEKAIKCLYVVYNQRIPKSHDLDMLISNLPDGCTIKARFTDLSELSFWAVESRYPGESPDAMYDDADRMVLIAKDVMSCVEQILVDNGFTG